MSNKWPLFNPNDQFYTDTGLPLSGGYLKFYDTGTTTKRAVYQDPEGVISSGYEVELDGDGRPPHVVYLDSTTEYRVVLTNSAGTTITTDDNVIGNSLGIATALSGVTLAKFATTDPNKLIGFPSGSAELITPAKPLSVSSSALSCSTLQNMYTFTSKTSYSGSNTHNILAPAAGKDYNIYITDIDLAGSTDTEIRVYGTASADGFVEEIQTLNLASVVDSDWTKDTLGTGSLTQATLGVGSDATTYQLAFIKMRVRGTYTNTWEGFGTAYYRTNSNLFAISHFVKNSASGTNVTLASGSPSINISGTVYIYTAAA